jgi:hypothetical protein
VQRTEDIGGRPANVPAAPKTRTVWPEISKASDANRRLTYQTKFSRSSGFSASKIAIDDNIHQILP